MYARREYHNFDVVKLGPETLDSIYGEYRAGKGCVLIAREMDLPLQTVMRVVRARTGGPNVRL
ncbi:MAG: hypothetical protein GX224_03115 [Thermoplasmatales archaeon]|nr:hypothetical protein [Thermoplasmatales archaeon]